jgi:hypothetical protein
MWKWIALFAIAAALMASGSARAATIIDMPPPPSRAADEVQSPGEKPSTDETYHELGRLALARYTHARVIPRDEYYAGPRWWPYRSYYGPGYWPFGSAFFFSSFCHFGFVPSVVVSHSAMR